MLKLQDQLVDNVADDVLEILTALHARPTWDGEKVRLFGCLESLLAKKRYRRFRGDFRDYHLLRKGEYCLYDVPAEQLGFLKRYRNKRVRLICMGSWNGYAGRFFCVSKVPAKN